MKEVFDRGSSHASVYHPETDDEYVIDCNWRYSHYPATYWEPEETTFETFNHELVSINGEKTKDPVPDWVDWDDYDEKIYQKELSF